MSDSENLFRSAGSTKNPMKTRFVAAVVVSLLIAQVFLNGSSPIQTHAKNSADVFVGIDIAYGDVSEAKALIDQVSSITNFIIIGTSSISFSPSKLNDTFQYAYDKGMYFMSLTPPLVGNVNRTAWLEYAKKTWGDHLLGFYLYDEPAGRQLDLSKKSWFNINPVNYSDAANQFGTQVGSIVNSTKTLYVGYPELTADYGLYWFDYKAGYDAIFTELGWNYSRQLNIALCRGAATMHNKDWGAMVLWTYTVPPYLETGPELYKDLVLAYDNGAKYITIFDTNEGYTAGILQQEHLQALQQFWQYVQSNPRKSNSMNARTAYVLPADYGFGFRGPTDKIWGFWENDPLAYNLSVSVNGLLEKYGDKLDIVYEDGLQSGTNYGYNGLIMWNANDQSTSPSPIPISTPALSPSPTPTAAPTPTPTGTPTRTPNGNPTSSPSQTPITTVSPESRQDQFQTSRLVTAIGLGIFLAVVVSQLVQLKRKRKKDPGQYGQRRQLFQEPCKMISVE